MNIAEAQTAKYVEGNMLCTAMRGTTALPGLGNPLRKKGACRNLGDLILSTVAVAILDHDGKSLRRSHWGRSEESDDCIVPMKPRTNPDNTGGGDGGGKAVDRREGE